MKELATINLSPDTLDYNIFDIEPIEFSEGIVLKCGTVDPQINLRLHRKLKRSLGTVICEITYTNTIMGNLQIFWDYGRGLSEKNSSDQIITPTAEATSILLPVTGWQFGTNLVALRIDPPNGTEFVLKSVRILNGGIGFEIQKIDYNAIYNNLRVKIKSKQKIPVAFFVIYDSVFPAKFLFEKMLNDDTFDPVIIVIPDVLRGEENMFQQVEKSYQTFIALYGNKKVLRGYIKETNNFIDYSDQFDIFCFCNPYDTMTHSFFKMGYLRSKKVLTFLLEYGHLITNFYSNEVIKSPIMNSFWKIFTESKYSYNEYKMNQGIKGKNVVISGFYNFEKYRGINKIPRQRKRIIIAPHHTIIKNNDLNLSNFLEYAEFFLKLPEIYPDIDFIFRPHPLLFVNLKKDDVWGKEKTDAWLNNLLKNKNVSYSDGGDFNEILIDSDAMIHDCGGFIIDYLFTTYPCCYMQKKDRTIDAEFTLFPKQCLKQYYKAYEEEDIKDFIDNVVIRNNDPLKTKRNEFYHKNLYQEHDASEKILLDIKKSIIKMK
jgi:hypothetical protein